MKVFLSYALVYVMVDGTEEEPDQNRQVPEMCKHGRLRTATLQ